VVELKYLKETAWETEYLSQIFALVPDINAIALHWRSERLFRRWFPALRPRFLKERLFIPDEVDERTVVVLLSDELYRIPTRTAALVVLKQYVSDKDKTSIPLPLGVRRGFPNLECRPMEDRMIDVGFIGRMYPHRKRFLSELSNHSGLKKFRLVLTSETRLSISEYSDFLNSTKVSLCLPGNFSPETFRFFESAKAGCIVVSPRMPRNGLYGSHPGVEVDQIMQVDRVAEVLRSILEASEEHEALQQRSLRAWDSQYSPSAVAAIVRRSVQSRVDEAMARPSTAAGAR
jgi:hypothetical protein